MQLPHHHHMGLHTRRRGSSPGPLPPFSPPAVPDPRSLLHHTRHESSPSPLPPLSPTTFEPPPLLHHNRHESSPGLLPPLSPPTISKPSPLLHESSPDPFPSISQPPPPVLESQNFHHLTARHNRRESFPGLSLPPMSPPPTAAIHSRRESYPGPFLSLPSPSSSEPPPPLYHTRRESCLIPFPFDTSTPDTQIHNIPQLTRYESDPGLLPSTSSPINHIFYGYNKRRLDLYDKDTDLAWPFGELNGLDHQDIRETAYEVFFTACRSEPGFGGRSALTFYSKHENSSGGASPRPVSVTSRVKRSLGLKMLGRSLSQRMTPGSGTSGLLTPSSPSSVVGGSPRSRAVPRRTLTMADVMRLQLGVSEQSESRLRKTLMRTLVGQVR